MDFEKKAPPRSSGIDGYSGPWKKVRIPPAQMPFIRLDFPAYELGNTWMNIALRERATSKSYFTITKGIISRLLQLFAVGEVGR